MPSVIMSDVKSEKGARLRNRLAASESLQKRPETLSCACSCSFSTKPWEFTRLEAHNPCIAKQTLVITRVHPSIAISLPSAASSSSSSSSRSGTTGFMACKLSRSLLTSTSAPASFPSPSPAKPPHRLKPPFFLPSVTALCANGNSSQQGEAIQHSRKDPLQQGRRPRDSSVLLLDSWDPFSRGGLRQMMETMDRLFLDDWAPARGGGRGSNRSSGSAGVRAPWDVVEDEEAYHIRVDMPGFSKEDVKVYIEDGVLVVSAERDQSKEESRWAAKSYNKFNTRLALPDNVQMDKVSAEMKNGVLFVVVPKVKPEERKKVLTVDIS